MVTVSFVVVFIHIISKFELNFYLKIDIVFSFEHRGYILTFSYCIFSKYRPKDSRPGL